MHLIQKCPVCNHDYQTGRIQVLDEAGNGFLAYLTCGFCSASILVRVLTLPHGLVGNAILTDLLSEEVLPFSAEERVTGNEVLLIHDLVKQADFIQQLK